MILVLLVAMVTRKRCGNKVQTLYVSHDRIFPEIEDFVSSCVARCLIIIIIYIIPAGIL